jgi:hypothetical protein
MITFAEAISASNIRKLDLSGNPVDEELRALDAFLDNLNTPCLYELHMGSMFKISHVANAPEPTPATAASTATAAGIQAVKAPLSAAGTTASATGATSSAGIAASADPVTAAEEIASDSPATPDGRTNAAWTMASTGIKAAIIVAKFIRKSTPGQSITPEKKTPPHRGTPNLAALRVGKNPFGISGCALIAAAACGTSAVEARELADKASKSPVKDYHSVDEIAKKYRLQVRQKDFLPPNLTILEIRLAGCRCEHVDNVEIPLEAFEAIFLKMQLTHESEATKESESNLQEDGASTSSGSALIKVQTSTEAMQLKSERRQQASLLASMEFVAKGKKDASALHKIWKVLRSGCWSSLLTSRHIINSSNCKKVWKLAFEILAGARVLSCNVRPGSKNEGESPWLKLPAELRRHVFGSLNETIDNALTQEQLTAVLSFASDRRTIGYGTTNEAVIAEKRLMDETFGRDSSGTSTDSESISVPKWSWRTSPAHPPYDWPTEVQSATTHELPYRGELTAAARAFLSATDTVNSRDVVRDDAMAEEARWAFQSKKEGKDPLIAMNIDFHSDPAQGPTLVADPTLDAEPTLDDSDWTDDDDANAAGNILAGTMADYGFGAGAPPPGISDDSDDDMGVWM